MRELVGEGKPLYSSLDRAAGLLKRKVGTGSEFLKELMAIPGVKQTEVAERGLGELLNAPKMTHEQFLKALGEKPAPAVEEKVFGEPLSSAELNQEANKLIRERARGYASAHASSSKEYRDFANQEMRRMRKYNRPEIIQFIKEYQHKEPHHSEWTIPGGENYREMLIKAPQTEDIFQGNPQHFGGEPGILASLRLKDRTGPNGEKLLHLEELQSDWHQQGRKGGYRTPDYEEQSEQSRKRMGEARLKWNKATEDFQKSLDYVKLMQDRLNSDHPDFRPGGYRRRETEQTKAFHEKRISDLFPMVAQLDDEYRKAKDEYDSKYGNRSKVVPDAPFKGNWEEMALKRLIHHAAEKGYDGIVVTPGNEQADRYDLSKHLDAVEYKRDPNGGGELIADDKTGRTVMRQRITNDDQLENYIGKDAAKNLLSQQPMGNYGTEAESYVLNNADLKVGGEGMRGFYDKKVPNILNSIGKKYGVKTQLYGTELQGRGKERTEDEFRQAVEDAGMTLANLPMNRAKEFDYEPKKIPAHYFPITDQMRQDVLKNGLPLYAEGGGVHTKATEATIDQMKYELSNRKG